MKRGLLLAVLAVYLCGSPPQANAAPMQAINFTAPTINFTNNTWSLGYAFTVGSTPVLATHLGFYDDLQNGLSQSHAVGLFTSGGTLLASTTVTNANALTGFFRYADIPDILLAPGASYVVAAVTGNENYTWNPTGFTVSPFITFNGDRYIQSGVLAFPTLGPSGVQGIFGANLIISDVPEPASLALFGVAAATAGYFGWRRRKPATV